MALGATAAPARAQDAPSANPTPQTIPGVLPERFRLSGAPTPTPTPSRSPSSAPTPLVQPVIVPTGAPAAKHSAPRPAPKPTPSPTLVATPSPQATTTTPATTPPAPKPAPSVTASPQQAAPVPADEWLAWPWFAVGLVGIAAVLGAGWWRWVRGRAVPDPASPMPVEPAARTAPLPVPPAPLAVIEPFEIQLVTAAVAFLADAVVFDLTLEVVNAQAHSAEGLRPALALISASTAQDQWRQAFHAGPPGQDLGAPIDLAPGARLHVPARLTLAREQVHVVTHGGRPMFVAMLLCDLRWRGGLSVHRFGVDFLLGTAGQGARPGPIWLDRPAPPALAAIRYLPQQS